MSNLKNLTHGQPVHQCLMMLSNIAESKTKNGAPYMVFTARDAHGNEMPGKKWQMDSNRIAELSPFSLFVVTGKADDFGGKTSIVAEILDPLVDVTPAQIEQFLPKTPRNVQQMWDSLVKIVRSRVKDDPFLSMMLERMLIDANLCEDFNRWPAATANHHAYLGGLLEHTWSLCYAADKLLVLYPQISPSVVLFSLFVHDHGKIEEMSWAKGLEYTTVGKLSGHLYIGARKWRERAELALHDLGSSLPCGQCMTECGIDMKVALATVDAVEHCILSHHGVTENDWGSVVNPQTPEAVLVSHIDNMDAKVFGVLKAVDRKSWEPSQPQWVKDYSSRYYRPRPDQLGTQQTSATK